MLTIKDLPDLKKYLETRQEMARRQNKDTIREQCHCSGMIYAYDESIKAIEALLSTMSKKD